MYLQKAGQCRHGQSLGFFPNRKRRRLPRRILFTGRFLPGNTLENLIRVHIRRIETGYYQSLSSQFNLAEPVNEEAFSNSSRRQDRITTDTYQWYEEGFRYPVFETVESCRTIDGKNYPLRKESCLYRPAGQAGLPADSANRMVLDKKLSAKKKSLTGKELHRINSESTANYRASIDMSAYPAGAYLLKVSSGKEIRSEKIVKQ